MSDLHDIGKKISDIESFSKKIEKKDEEIKHHETTEFWMMISMILLIILLGISIYFMWSSLKSVKQLRALNYQVQEQQEELKQANYTIEEYNRELERKVEQRTHELKMQTRRVMNYATFNAHKLRAPLARLLGLLNIMKVAPESIKDQELIDMLNKEANDLDEEVTKAGKILYEGQKIIDNEDLPKY